ncbi:MAG TPA: hypothetical protein PKC24_00730, partial [Cyclobacteriaceae bacterium]|nr:hypothetical protein [Cyclobacteriaceae bacterium]
MIRLIFYITLSLLANIGFAQGNGAAIKPGNFPDSIAFALNAYRTDEARQIATDFSALWPGFGLDQQKAIKQHHSLLQLKGYRSRPIIINFFAALVNAKKFENLSNAQFNAYLDVLGKTVMNESAENVQEFLRASRVFFRHHALHFDRSYRLSITEDVFRFDYVEPAQIILTESSDADDWDDWGNDNWDDDWDDDSNMATPATGLRIFKQPQPEPLGPVIVFERLSLNFVTASDSVFLRQTKGTYDFNQKTFIGEGGVFDWSVAGLPGNEVYVTLGEYNFKVNKPSISSQEAYLTHRENLRERAEGIFEWRSVNRAAGSVGQYPQFKSYESNIEILGLSNDRLKYRGGFTLEGQKISSTSVSRQPSVLQVFGVGGRKFQARATSFEFVDSTIISSNAAVAIYQGNDSIVSTAVQFRFNRATNNLTLQPRKGLMRGVPYSASYFNVDFSSEILRWNIDADSLNIFTAGGRGTVPFVVESADYFDPEDFRLLSASGLGYHPAGLVAAFSKKYNTAYTNLDALSSFSGKKIEELHAGMEFLASKGLVEYKPMGGEVIIRPRVVKMFEAYHNESDYDNMKIHSVIDSQANATINLNRNDIIVRGVEGLKVSDSLNVIIIPDKQTVRLLKDRDMKFDGRISAGNFEILGKNFTLKYDSFFINLKQIDSIRFFVTETNAYGQKVRRLINNPMVGVDSLTAAETGMTETPQSGGTLFIAKPNNKSGKSGAGNFPRLDATTGGVIYFNRKEVLNGAYDRSVYFVAPPFSLDSLSDMDVGAIRFEGTFVSSGMFPNFKEKLHTMPDRSLGFDHSTPSSGYKLFNQDAKFTGNINLSNRGIRTSGFIDYLAATAESADFVFYPDSVVGSGVRAEIRQEQFGSVIFPKAELKDFEMKWLPKQDRMIFKNTKQPFQFYDNTAQLDGTAIVTRQGVRGTGRLISRGSEAISDELTFNTREYSARHADFKVNSGDPDKPILSGSDIRLRFNLDQNFADISPEIAGEAALNFPYAQFRTS